MSVLFLTTALLCISMGCGFQQLSSNIVSIANEDKAPISFVSDDGLVCFEGYDELMVDTAISMMRATPLYQLFAVSGFTVGQSCQGLGYETLFSEHDQCLVGQGVSSWVKNSQDFEAFVATMHVIEDYGLERGLASGTATAWASCPVCPGGVLWGQTAAPDCASFSNNQVADELQNARSSVGSFVPDNEAVCFEGELGYITAALSRTATAPFGVIFTEAAVSEQTCAERGYSRARDVIDECWPQAVKYMKVESENEDMGTWVGSYPTAISSQDQALGLSEGTSMLWTACVACETGGAVRDRGMWITWDGGASEPVTDEMCKQDFGSIQLTQNTPNEKLTSTGQ